jgi:hypothetical protein
MMDSIFLVFHYYNAINKIGVFFINTSTINGAVGRILSELRDEGHPAFVGPTGTVVYVGVNSLHSFSVAEVYGSKADAPRIWPEWDLNEVILY